MNFCTITHAVDFLEQGHEVIKWSEMIRDYAIVTCPALFQEIFLPCTEWPRLVIGKICKAYYMYWKDSPNDPLLPGHEWPPDVGFFSFLAAEATELVLEDDAKES